MEFAEVDWRINHPMSIPYVVFKFNHDILKWGDPELKKQSLSEINVIVEANRSLYNQYTAKHQEMMRLAGEIYGLTSNQVKYLRNQRISRTTKSLEYCD